MSPKDQRSKGRDARLEELANALKEAQLMLLRQNEQLESADEDDDEPLRALAEARRQLEIVTAERDKLQEQLLALERMQTETVAMPEDADEEPPAPSDDPSIDELMTSLSALSEERVEQSPVGRISGPSAEAPEVEVDEMISPEDIAPEVFAAEADTGSFRTSGEASRMLIYVDSERPVRVPLPEGTVTIGRAESANIRIDGPYVSRIHARIVATPEQTVIEDAGSKNGFKVNSIAVERHTLQHGDVINIGQRRFTFVDSSNGR